MIDGTLISACIHQWASHCVRLIDWPPNATYPSCCVNVMFSASQLVDRHVDTDAADIRTARESDTHRTTKTQTANTNQHTRRDGELQMTNTLMIDCFALLRRLYCVLGSFSSPPSSSSSSTDPWSRLSSTPCRSVSREISSLYSDVRNCTFQPIISPLGHQLQRPSFKVRTEESVKRFHQQINAKPTFTGDHAQTTFTFQPNLHTRTTGKKDAPTPTSARGSIANFLSRVDSASASRSARRAALLRAAEPTFTPVLSPGTCKRATKMKADFLERLEEDIEKREANERRQRRIAQTIPYTFIPHTEASEKNGPDYQPDLQEFIARMDADVHERKVAYTQRTDDLAKKYVPPPPPPPPTVTPHPAHPHSTTKQHNTNTHATTRTTRTKR